MAKYLLVSSWHNTTTPHNLEGVTSISHRNRIGNVVSSTDVTNRAKFVLLVNGVPDQINRPEYQHTIALCKRFDTKVVAEGDVSNDIESQAISVVSFKSSSFGRFKVLLPFWLLYHSIITESCATICSPHGIYILSAWVSSVIRRRKMVIDFWDDPYLVVDSYSRTTEFTQKFLYWWHLFIWFVSLGCIRRSDLIITSIHPEILQKYQVEDSSVVTLTNGVSKQFIRPNDNPPIESAIRITYVGQVNEKRRIFNVINQISSSSFAPSIEIDLVGPYDSHTLEKVREIDGDMTVNVHGKLPHERAIEIIERTDICLCILPPEIENYRYSYPVKMFEYAALGKAIVASDFQGIRHLFTDRIDSLLIDPRERGSIITAVEFLCRNPKVRSKLGKNAQQTAKKCVWETITTEYISALDGLCNNARQ